MRRIEIFLCSFEDRNHDILLSWDILEHDAAFFWFNLFCRELRSSKKYFTRFTGFVHGYKNLDFLLKSLNECIDIINEDGRYKIPEKALVFNQEFSNIIHHHFELLIGDRDNQTKLYLESSDKVRRAIEGLNFLIHDLEAYDRNVKSYGEGALGSVFSGIILEVANCERFKIPSSFNEYFTMNLGFGDLVAHYSQVGKTWLETFYDQDEEIFPEAIRPLYAFSGECDIMFGKLSPDETFKKNLGDFLKKNGKDILDPSLRLGHLPLAKFNWDLGYDESVYKVELSRFCDLKMIRVYEDYEIIAERSFENTTLLFE